MVKQENNCPLQKAQEAGKQQQVSSAPARGTSSVTEVALRGRVRSEEAPRGPAASPVLSRAPQAWTPACRGPGPGFAQLSTPVRRKRLRRPGIRELGGAQGASPDGLARGEGARSEKGPCRG